MNEVFKYSLAVFTILNGIAEVVILHLTKTSKHAVKVFLTNKCCVLFFAGCCLLARCICTTMEIINSVACNTILGGMFIVEFSYLASMVLSYIDLHMSLKRMTINDPPISKTKAVIFSVLTWIVGAGVGAIGFLFQNPEWQGDSMEECMQHKLFHLPEYTIFKRCLLAALLIVLLAVYIATDKLLRDSIRNNQQLHNANREGTQAAGKPNKQANYLDDRMHVMKIMAIKTWIAEISWGLCLVIGIVGQRCEWCVGQDWLKPTLRLIPIVTSSWIYLFNNKSVRESCGRFCRLCR